MFLHIPVSATTPVPASPYADLLVRVVIEEYGPVFEVSTRNDRLFREFHYFAELFVEEVDKSKDSVVTAFNRSLAKWLELGAKRTVLTPDQQLGLLGELTLLGGLLQVAGVGALSAWTGRNEQVPDRHDFRLSGVDVEVKSTRGARREHVIHGIKQLTPTLGHELYLLSFRFQPAGGGSGKSLRDAVRDIRALLSGAPELELFNRQVVTAGYRDVDDSFYADCMKLADKPVLIKVDANCPRLTEDIMEIALGAHMSSRVRDVTYRLDVEGLGETQGSVMFNHVLGDLGLK